MKKFLLGFLFFSMAVCSCFSLFAAASSKSDFSLLTCSNGDEVYSVFGHSALRFKDDSSGIDIVYNYGLFSFDTESFLYKFVKGETDYLLGVEHYRSFIRGYVREQRDVYEHVLDLTIDEKNTLLSFLANNALPENRIYRYNYMFDNCSSRLRDILEVVLGDNLSWDGNEGYDALFPHQLAGAEVINSYYTGKTTPSFRDILDLYSKDFPWVDCGIYMPIGVPADKKASLRESMFIPDFLMNAYCHAMVVRNGERRPLVKEFNALLEFNKKPDVLLFSHPVAVMWLVGLFLIIVTIIGVKRKNHLFFIDGILYFIIGFFGVVVWFVSCVSVHPAVFFNYNLLWILPTHLLIPLLMPFKKMRPFVKKYMLASGIVSMFLVFFWFLVPQSLHMAHYPIVIALTLRSLHAGLHNS